MNVNLKSPVCLVATASNRAREASHTRNKGSVGPSALSWLCDLG